ncbi:BCL-6 corepressor-like [Amphiura filiformis]|uniref:BCL-6 corepressor-like n=1 Tax=Amphiura filiformis TaxID=82378 RepID=UPI003B21167E
MQRPLQVLMDPDNHTKLKFVSLNPNAKTDTMLNDEPVSGKRKKKTKHLGPTSPSQCKNDENCNMSCGDENDAKTKHDDGDTLTHIQIKQEPFDPGYETEPVTNQPPPVQIVRPEPPADLKKLICNKKLGETVLHRACRMARDDVAIYCIDYQMCDINTKDNAGYTPLHECCVNGCLQVAEHLLRHGADVNASAADGTRPIHDAVDNHHMDIVRLLLAFGADPLVATYSGRTPLTLARNQQMRSFIIGYLRDVNGEWELDKEEYPDCVDTLQDTEWRFRSSIASSIDCKSDNDGVGVFGEIHNDDSPSEESTLDDDIMFEFCETPHLQTYNLQLARDNGPRNWLLLADVRKALGGKLDDVINTCEDVEPITITRREFNYALREGLASLPADMPPKVHGHVSDSETVELVALNDSIRQALDIDTEFVR